MPRRAPLSLHAATGLFSAAAIAVFCGISPSALAWERPHGDGANTSFADVVTAPATKRFLSVGDIGSFAPGAGPVIAPDGTLYIGNEQGELIALHADGTPFWRRNVGRGQAIVASPVIGADGTVYVIGVKKYRDQRVNPPVVHIESTLHRFTGGGGWLGQTPFPDHGGHAVAAVAPPNVWRSGAAEVVLAPAAYGRPAGGGHDLRLIAFSTGGRVLADQVVSGYSPTATSGTGMPDWQVYACIIPPFAICVMPTFDPQGVNTSLVRIPPPPAVATFTFASGGAPIILVSDHMQDLVGYTFSGNSFNERFRAHEKDFYMRSAPVILPDGYIIGEENIDHDNIGTERPGGFGRVLVSGPNTNNMAPIQGAMIFASPTRMADGRIVVIDGLGKITVLQGGQVIAVKQALGQTIVSAAASRTHLFVSAADGFTTYDGSSLAEVSRIDWGGGGLNPPAIGPQGHVYAIASNILFVFLPPAATPLGSAGGGGQSVQPSAANPEPSPAPPGKSSAQTYKPPLTTNGNRLFACEAFDGDDCGKGDAKNIALAFCQKQGFTAADDIKTDTKKGKAETLDGQFCTKKKCKVFDKIVCKK